MFYYGRTQLTIDMAMLRIAPRRGKMMTNSKINGKHVQTEEVISKNIRAVVEQGFLKEYKFYTIEEIERIIHNYVIMDTVTTLDGAIHELQKNMDNILDKIQSPISTDPLLHFACSGVDIIEEYMKTVEFVCTGGYIRLLSNAYRYARQEDFKRTVEDLYVYVLYSTRLRMLKTIESIERIGGLTIWNFVESDKFIFKKKYNLWSYVGKVGNIELHVEFDVYGKKFFLGNSFGTGRATREEAFEQYKYILSKESK